MSLASQICNAIEEAAAGNPTGEPSIPFVLALTQPDGASGDLDWTITGNHVTRVIDAWSVKTGGAGGAVNTTQVQNGAGTAITDALDLNVADQTISRAGTIDDANHEIAAGGTIRLARVKAGGNAAALVYVLCVKS